MSADDFQTKYASVMESMLRSAVAETTKLFETMVDELKAEITRIKRENEDLKARCCQIEMARSPPVIHGSGDDEHLAGPSGGSQKRDSAVQCDLDAFHTVLVEESQPLRCSSLQSLKHHGCEEMVYALQEHDYGTPREANSQMAFILVKQESVMKQEEVESKVVGGKGFSDKDSSWASPCAVESEGPFITTVCSTGEMPLSAINEETQVTPELPFKEAHCGLQGAQNQSSELEHSLVISLAAIKDGMEERSEVSQKMSEVGTQGVLLKSDHLLVAQHQSEVEPPEKELPSVVPQSESETSINKQSDIILQQYADVQAVQNLLTQSPHLKFKAVDVLQSGVAEVETSSKSDMKWCRRGRPPKKTKHLQRPVKDILKSACSDVLTVQEVKNSPAVRVEEVEVSSAVDTVDITSSKSPQAYPVQLKDSSSIITPSVQVVSLALSAASQIPMDVGDGAIHASSAAETLKTTLAESPHASSIQSGETHTSVTLQDAMLLVEAMYQSMAENVFSRQRMTAAPQTMCTPNVVALPTVDEAPAQLRTSLHPVETITTQSTIEMGSASPQTDVTPFNKKHELSLSNTTTSTISQSAQRNVQALQQQSPHPLITSLATSKQGKVVPQKIIVVPRSVSSLLPHKIATSSPNQIPRVTSRVVAAQNGSLPPGHTAAGLPSLGTPSISSVPQKTIYVASRKSLPVVKQSATASTDLQSRILLHPKITVIPAQVSGVGSRKHQSQTIVFMPRQESTKTSAPAMVPSPQLVSSSQEMTISVDTQTTIDEVETKLSVKRMHTSESPKQVSLSETMNAHAETCYSFNMSVGPVSTSQSPEVPLTVKQKLAPVVRLTRLPFPISTSESVPISRLTTNRSCSHHTILKAGTTQEKLSSVVISTQPSETLGINAEICPSFKETAVAMSISDSKMSKGSNDVQEKPSLSTDNYTTLEGVPHSFYVQSSASSNVPTPDLKKSIIAINTTESSVLSGRDGEPTSNLDEEPISIATQNCSIPYHRPVEEKQSTSLMNLTSITSQETSDHSLQVIKAQFLAQLAVSPPSEDLEKASCNDSQDARVSCAENSTNEMKRLQTDSLMAQLRSHIKTHLQARRNKIYPGSHTEKETQTVSPKKPRLENGKLKDKNTTNEHIPLDPKNPGAVEDITLLPTTFDASTPISVGKFGLCKDAVKPMTSDSESCSISCRRSKTTSEFTLVRPQRFTSGKDGIGCENEKSTFVSPRRSSTRKSAISKKTRNISMRTRRTSSARDDPSPNNTNADGHPNNVKTTSIRPKRTILSRDGVSHKMILSTSLSPKTSSKNSPKIFTSESPSLIRRTCTSSKSGSNNKRIKRESSSFSPMRGSITKDANDPTNTGVSTCVKKPRLIQDGTSPKKKLGVLNANAISKEGKAKSIGKMKNSNQSKSQNGAKTSQPAEDSGRCEAVRKCATTAVWIPPKMLISAPPPAGGKRSVHLSIKKETSSLKSKDRQTAYPPSVSLHPIPVKAPPVVSPLQPLSVIGRYLLKNQCGECGRVLSSSAALESHVSLHTGQRPFSCTLCGKRFIDSKALKRHGRVHRNGRIHVCQQCGKGFVYRFGLTKHLQMVHSRIKPFVCQICNKGCFTKLDVEAHIRIHTGEKPFHCNLCERKFTRRVDLNVHLRWHNGEKRHWCPYCGKGFLDFNNLKRHKYIHTGEKPHACPHCPKHFTQSGHLKKHVKNVHKTQ